MGPSESSHIFLFIYFLEWIPAVNTDRGTPGSREAKQILGTQMHSLIIGDKHKRESFISNCTQQVSKQTRTISNGLMWAVASWKLEVGRISGLGRFEFRLYQL